MITTAEISTKQIVAVFANAGEKLSFSNDNLVVRDESGKIKLQTTCYRLMLVFVVGNITISSGLVQRAKKFRFSIVLMTNGFRVYQIIGAQREGNTVLHRLQYAYQSLDVAKHITKNKIDNQRRLLMSIRNRMDTQDEGAEKLLEYLKQIDFCAHLQDIMGLEGAASRIFFPRYFDNVNWGGRQPRIKRDMLNALLDIGYTLLFSYMETLLNFFGFDAYCGMMHRDFYMRKSLVCDFVEPFRCLIEQQVKKGMNLKQFREEDFQITNGRYDLKWSKNAEYISTLLKPVLDRREELFLYVQQFYRAFMNSRAIALYPIFNFVEQTI